MFTSTTALELLQPYGQGYDFAIEGAKCGRGAVCAVTTVNEVLYVYIVDHLKWSHPNRTLELRLQHVDDLYSTSIEIEDEDGWINTRDVVSREGIYQHPLVADRPTMVLIEVRIDGSYAPDTPVLVRVKPGLCSLQGQVYTTKGCACPDGTTALLADCMDVRAVGLTLTAVAIIILLGISSSVLYCWNRKADRRWLIHPNDVMLLQQEIGSGSRGPVFRGDYKNTDVVVKPLKRNTANTKHQEESISVGLIQCTMNTQLLCAKEIRARMRIIT